MNAIALKLIDEIILTKSCIIKASQEPAANSKELDLINRQMCDMHERMKSLAYCLAENLQTSIDIYNEIIFD